MPNTSNFYKKCPYNHETQEQMWCSLIGDSHDSFCGCDKPFCHLLASIFPPGHQDRNLTIQQILIRDSQCHSGGEEDASPGMAKDLNIKDSTERKEDPENIKEEDTIEDLLFAAAAAAEER